MDVVLQDRSGWKTGRVRYARRFFERWRGLKDPEASDGVLMRTRSVHGFGMDAPFVAVALSGDMDVVDMTLIQPGQVVWFSGARFVLELPEDSMPPASGARLTMSHV